MLAALAALADGAVAAARHRRTCAGTRPTGWPRWRTELTGLGGDVAEQADGLHDRAAAAARRRRGTPTPTTGWRPPARCSGWRVDGVDGRRHRRTTKTLPDFPGLWAAHARQAERDMARGATPVGWTRTTSASAPTRAAPGRAPSSGRRTTTPPTGMVVTVDRGRYAVLVDDAEVTAMRARELGRKGDRGRRPGRRRRRPVRRAGHAGPHRPGRRARAPCCAAPPTTTTRTSG